MEVDYSTSFFIQFFINRVVLLMERLIFSFMFEIHKDLDYPDEMEEHQQGQQASDVEVGVVVDKAFLC